MTTVTGVPRGGVRLGGLILVLHLAALSVLMLAPGFWYVGLVAYALGLRHAFDVDHIAAIDNVTRKLWHDGRRPLFTGFFFSLGHSTVVVALSLVVVVSLHHTRLDTASLGAWGSLVGGFVSATFLTLIGAVNAVLLVRSVRACRRSGAGQYGGHDSLHLAFEGGGLMSRMLGGVYRHVDTSWKMYPLGFLFGLGFDTASEIAVLGLSAVASRDTHISLWVVMAFPLLFAAGMTLVDSIDAVMLLRAYEWSRHGGGYRKLLNLSITGISVTVALAVAALEWCQLMTAVLPRGSDIRQSLAAVDFPAVGACVTALLMLAWAGALVYQRRFKPTMAPPPATLGR